MKTVIIKLLASVFFCMAAYSCVFSEDTREGETTVLQDKNAPIGFSLAVPRESVVDTRGAVEEGVLHNVYVLVFNQHGTFLSRTRAVRGNDPASYTVSLVPTDPHDELPAEDKVRIVHFVCNYDWTGFSDVMNLGKHENEVISSLAVTGGNIIYWQRVVLGHGVCADSFEGSVIRVVRNTAKVSVYDNTIYNPIRPFLVDATFALGDYYDSGTVAPFNTSTLAFDETSVTESPAGNLQNVREEDFVEAGSRQRTSRFLLCYERENSTADRPMYVIVKGKYSEDNNYTYYKIDIVREGLETLCDIRRNCHYVLEITEITGPGSATLQEAVNSPASNNLLYSVLLKEYTSISDGRSVLNVETTAKTLVRAGEAFSLKYSYIPDIHTGAENNTIVEFELEQQAGRHVVDPSSVSIVRTPGSASYTATTVGTLPEYDIHNARLIVKAVNNGIILRRAIELRLRKPSEFTGVRLDPRRVPAGPGQRVDVHFNIPDNILSTNFPMKIYFTTRKLSPNLDAGLDDHMTIDHAIPGRYRFVYTAEGPGDHVAHFKTTSATTGETMTIESELFTPYTLQLSN